MMKSRRNRIKAKHLIFPALVSLAIPAGVVLLSSNEITGQAIDNGKVLNVTKNTAARDKTLIALVELKEGSRVELVSVPISVQVGDELPIIVETHVFKKNTYRFDAGAWGARRK